MGGPAMSGRGGALRLLAELVLREDGVGEARRWRHYTAAEIAAGALGSGGGGELGTVTEMITAVLNGHSEDIPDQLIDPLAAFFRVDEDDLTRGDLQASETAILERLVRDLGAGNVLFCRDHLDRHLANQFLRAVLNAVRRPCTGSCDCGRELPP